MPHLYMEGLGGGDGHAPVSALTISHPILGDGLKYSSQVVPDDPDSQVQATIELMRRYAQEDAWSPEIQRQAQAIRAQCGSDRACAVQQVWGMVQKKIQFLNDERTAQPIEPFFSQLYSGAPIVEILIRPRDMANMARRVGDCDDYSMYAASLLLALGLDCSFVTIAGNQRDPGHFTHVYVAAYPDGFEGGRIAVDASHGPYCGWEGKQPGTRCAEWKVSNGAGEPRDSARAGAISTLVFVGLVVAGAIWALK